MADNIRESFEQILLDTESSCKEPISYAVFLHSYLRGLLQFALYPLAEMLLGQDRSDLLGEYSGTALLSPSDGDLVSILNCCIGAARQTGWNACAGHWDRATNALGPTKKRLYSWTKERNDSVGHGVMSRKTATRQLEWLPDLAKDTTGALADILDRCTVVPGSERLHFRAPSGEIQVETLRFIDGRPCMLRSIERRGSTWRTRCQVISPDDGGDEHVRELDAGARVVRSISEDRGLFATKSVHNNEEGSAWRPLCCIPLRQTDRFTGREEELGQICEWYSDVETRAGMVFGEGGVGKTTLAIEFLNRLVEGGVTSSWRPQVIAFYSAKETAWDSGGMRNLLGVEPNLDEAVRLVIKALHDELDTSWYQVSGRALVSKAANELRKVGLARGDVLLIVDNVETLAHSQGQEKEVAGVLRDIARNIGRILITSRRREFLEAMPIQVQPLTLEQSFALLEALCAEYSAATGEIEKVRNSFARDILAPLDGRPLLIDAVVRVAAQNRSSLADAARIVRQAANADLGVFLFEDALKRVGEATQDTLIALARLGGNLPGDELATLAAGMGGTFQQLLDAIDETKLCSVLVFGRSEEYVLTPNVRLYLETKYRKMPAHRKTKVAAAVAALRSRVAALASVDERFSDRIANAYRTEEAKAAKLAARKSDHELAIAFYQEALVKDSGNVALFERVAWYYFMIKHDNVRARDLVDRALAMDPAYSEALFTRALIAVRDRDVALADDLLDRATTNGKPKHVCTLQKVKARLHGIESDIGGGKVRARTDVWREEAERFLREASIAQCLTSYDSQHEGERREAMNRLEGLAARIGRIGPARG